MERSTIWSLSSPGGRLFGGPARTFITRSEGGCAAASTPPDAVEVLFPNTDALVDVRFVFDPMGAGREMPLHRVDVDLTALYPLWTADDTSSCDDCPVQAYSELAWRDQADEREVL